MNDINNKQYGSFISKLLIHSITLLFLLFPLLDQYEGVLDKISLGETVLIISIVLLFLFQTRVTLLRDKRVQMYALFLIIALLLSFLSGLTQHSFPFLEMVLLWVRMVVYFIFVLFLGRVALADSKFLDFYIIISLVLCVYLFVQYFSYYGFHYILPNYLGFLNVRDSLSAYAGRDMEYVYSVAFRPSSLFSEPAKMAHYLIPVTIILLFKNNRSSFESFSLITIILGIFLSTSFLGAFITLLLTLYYSIVGKKDFKQVVLTIFILLIIIFVLDKTEIIDANISRIVTGLTAETNNSSAALRLLRGWEIFYKIPFLNKIVGVGLNGIAHFLNVYNIDLVYGGAYLYGEYCSTFTYILNTCGLLGFSLLAVFFVLSFKTGNAIVRIIILTTIIMSLGSSFFVTPTWVMLLSLIFFYVPGENYEYRFRSK